MTRISENIHHSSRFSLRHLGPSPEETAEMLAVLGYDSIEALAGATVPDDIQFGRSLDLPAAATEHQALTEIRGLARKNRVFRSLIGLGYHATYTPAVIQRNILENPGWYTAYTPYQPEIAQGRLEALLNFQTLITDLTGMEISNASLLDEPTAAAEAMTMAVSLKRGRARFFVADDCHPQTISLLRGRAESLGVELIVGDPEEIDPSDAALAGALLQYPSTTGRIRKLGPLIQKIHEAGGLAVVAADLMSLVLLEPPGALGADVVVGSAQRFGVPMMYGGPHAGYLATKDAHKRRMPGRLIGLSRDADGNPALRLTLQTREQHIRREKATSNICTAQVLLAVMASMYAVYHGAEGLREIAGGINERTRKVAAGLKKLGFEIENDAFFDTLSVPAAEDAIAKVRAAAEAEQINFRYTEEGRILISFDEVFEDLPAVFRAFGASPEQAAQLAVEDSGAEPALPEEVRRTSSFLDHPVFHTNRTETELLRYIRRLEAKDLSLTGSMIALGSCTMKLNATSEMLPVTWPEFAELHPFAPLDQAEGYRELFAQLEAWLGEITGFAGVSLQPNAGSQGEYAGLMVIRKYHTQRGEGGRNVCLIPTSAHGTNPASAILAGYKVVPVRCDSAGNIDLDDLRSKAETHASELGALMVTYPSTHGVFEKTIREVCRVIHEHGGQIYLDGANMNALVGLCRPADFGADVCHLNLHKTFCIPHGGGGPGVGPIGVASHLVPFLPGHALVKTGGDQAIAEISGAPWGSAGILPISWMYIRMMGPDGLKAATEMAILNANYIAARVGKAFPVLYTGANSLVAHECILDVREWNDRCGIDVEDIAKRLIDYGFHAPTMSWPVAGTLMVEPTESESKDELDRFCDALISIHAEINAVDRGEFDRDVNPLTCAPHTVAQVSADKWERPYSRETGAYPAPWLRVHRFWPPVSRVDNVYGDRNVFCSCPPVSEVASASGVELGTGASST